MAITYTKNETFDGTRVQTMPDPDNEGETISETLTGIRDIEVTFTEDSTTPHTVHTRMVNVCFEADGLLTMRQQQMLVLQKLVQE